MMAALQKISTKGMSREEWLALRRRTIGGSDAAAIVGLSKWASPFSVWAEKTGRMPEKEDTEPMRQGRDLEDYVARRWCEKTGKRVRRENSILYNPAYPFAHACPDRLVIAENAGLECKTTSALNLRQFHTGSFPEAYYCQCMHYLAVTGADRWYLSVLVLGKEFHTFTLERDQAEIDALMTAEAGFWKLVQEDTPPAPDGTQATSEALGRFYQTSGPEAVELFGRQGLLDEYTQLQEQKAALDSRIGEITNTLKADLQMAERGTCGPYTVSWRTQERRIFQPKAFSMAHPGIDISPFYKISQSRPFKITKEA